MDGADRIVLQNSLKATVLELAHAAKIAGHPGPTRVFATIIRTWY